VHQAPAFGEDDYRVCVAHNIVSDDENIPCPVNSSGIFTEPVTDLVGLYVKDADKQIQKILKQQGKLIRQSQISHSYPFCWRSDTPLIYKAVPSWFVRVSNIVDKLLKNNKESRWFVFILFIFSFLSLDFSYICTLSLGTLMAFEIFFNLIGSLTLFKKNDFIIG